jgi:hypothetical protein
MSRIVWLARKPGHNTTLCRADARPSPLTAR